MSPDGALSLDLDRCTGCGLCARVCASLVIDLVPGPSAGTPTTVPHLARPDWCSGCGQCEAVCPVEAIQAPLSPAPDAPRPGSEPAVDPRTLDLLLRERRSVRIYKDRPVPRELLSEIVDIARYTPTGTNNQNVHWLVLDDPGDIGELRRRVLRFYERIFRLVQNPLSRGLVRLGLERRQYEQLVDYLPTVREAERRMETGDDRLLYHAPAVILVHAEAWNSCSAFNCDAALFAASLAAHARGLGCCFNGFVQQAVENDRRLARWLGIPRDHRCYMTLGLGWPAIRYRRLVEREPAKVRWFGD